VPGDTKSHVPGGKMSIMLVTIKVKIFETNSAFY
jgi:hypothetical protein